METRTSGSEGGLRKRNVRKDVNAPSPTQLINTEHDRVRGDVGVGAQVEPTDVVDLADQFGVDGESERLSLPRLYVEGPPSAGDRGVRDLQVHAESRLDQCAPRACSAAASTSQPRSLGGPVRGEGPAAHDLDAARLTPWQAPRPPNQRPAVFRWSRLSVGADRSRAAGLP